MKRLFFFLVALLCGPTAHLHAQSYPSKPVQLILTSAPGSSVEVLGRGLATALSTELGQPVVPQNRPGGANTVGTILVASTPADGYTLGFTASGPFASQPYLQTLPYSINDFEYICQLFELQVTLAVADGSPYKTLSDVIEAARAAPGKIAVGTTGVASIPHIVLKQIEELKGVKFNFISYQGDAQALQATLGGEIAMVGLALGTIANQPVRALGTFGRQRETAYPNVPTGSEMGLPIVKTGMVGLFARKPLSPDIRSKLDSACLAASKNESLKTLAKNMNQPVEYVDGPEWQRRIAIDAADNKAVIDRLGMSHQ